MKAEDTVMRRRDINTAYLDAHFAHTGQGKQGAGHRGIAKAQAEISFKAGIREAIEWLYANLLDDYETIDGSPATWFKEEIGYKPTEIYKRLQELRKTGSLA